MKHYLSNVLLSQVKQEWGRLRLVAKVVVGIVEVITVNVDAVKAFFKTSNYQLSPFEGEVALPVGNIACESLVRLPNTYDHSTEARALIRDSTNDRRPNRVTTRDCEWQNHGR